MSIYDFFPMKKRKICKTPSGQTRRRTNGSTLGKLKKSLDGSAPGIGDNGIEILWDNNSPSPTTTIALAGKRRRRQNGGRGEETGVTDLSFVVQKFSENTSPVVDHTHSALLEMWCNKTDQHKNHGCEEEFTSPPFQTRHKKSPLSTPLNKRRISNRTSRKVTRQFMLEIRKLVDVIQKSDLSSCSSQSQKECRIEDQARSKRAKKNAESSTKVTQLRPSLTTNGEKPCNASTSEPGTTKSDPLLEDSFEWTEDDMDELILTCQLSSSGKGSLTIPELPRPQFGFSPSQMFVPETQMLSQAPEITQLNINHAAESDHAQEVPTDKWEINFDEDDSLLASAVQEFELSQEAMPKTKSSPKKENNCKKNSEFAFSFQKPLKMCPLTTTASNSSHGRENSIAGKVSDVSKPFTTTQTNARNMSEKANSTRQLNKNTAMDVLGGKIIDSGAVAKKISDGSKQFGRMPSTTQTNSRNFPEKGIGGRQYSANILGGQKIDPKTKEDAGKIPNDIAATQAKSVNFSEKENGGGQYSTNVLGGQKTDPKTKDAGGKITGAITQAKSINLPENGNGGRHNVSSIATPSQRTKLSLRRGASGGTKPCTSYDYPARSNENYPRNNVRTQPRANEASSSPLRSIPGNLSYPEKQSRLRSSKVVPSRGMTTTFTKETVEEIFGAGRSNVKESKSSVMQTKKGQSNEFDFLLCEENFAALLEEFNFDDVPTKVPTQVPAKTTTNNFNKSCGNKSAPSVSTVGEKKTTYSKDEIERKRLEAQRRRLAKQKNTARNCTRISKR